MDNTETVAGITYSLPTVFLLQETGIGTAEYAARTCYDSFENSENKSVKAINQAFQADISEEALSIIISNATKDLNIIEHSDLLDDLAWTYFHHSILEHANLTFLIKGTSRAVLQEHARHRIQAISVRSTRYTMSSVINAFIASVYTEHTGLEAETFFIRKMKELNLLVTTNELYNEVEFKSVFSKLLFHRDCLGTDEFLRISVSKDARENGAMLADNPESMFQALELSKKKRNVGDAFKHIVTDNWKVDMVVTMNLRALKNYFELRDSGAAYFQIRHLAQTMKQITPEKYLKLIDKSYRKDT